MPALLVIAVVVACGALLFGSLQMPASEVFHALFSSNAGIGDVAHDVIWQLRLPRVFAAFACGALLAVSGVLLQALLRNPLADPYVLGIAGGAAIGALIVLLCGIAGIFWLHMGALLGALVAIAIVFLLSFRSNDWNIHRLLLTGVVLSSGFAALISLFLVVAPQTQLKGMLFWLMGDLSNAGNSAGAWSVLLFVVIVFTLLAKQLDVLALGQLKARALGIAVTPLQIALYVGAALATVAAVLLGGSIGFVGMMIPHALRLLGIHQHRLLIPCAALFGGSFVVVADTFARTIWAPQQLPVGVFTALVGVPLLLVLLSRKS